MTNKQKPFTSEKWLHYQDVKVLKTKVKPTEDDKKKVEEFRKFIDEKIKKEEDTKREK